MCGIAGIAGLRDTAAAERAVGRMTRRIAHRGPDAEGFFVEDGIALGHRRLSVIDLSDRANQPQHDPTQRYAITFNGEIYNFQDVKRRFPGYPYRTHSDTECILAAYSATGARSPEVLNGMFAFAIWDRGRQELFLARDRLGVKPLYYATTADGAFIFASEIRAILASGLVERKLNAAALAEYLVYQSVYAPRSLVDGIHQFPAGSYGVYREGRLEITPYWQLEQTPVRDDFGDPEAVTRRVRTLLSQSVERRMVSDVRLGAFLSGGIDSSAIVALMSEVSDQPVETFSVTFDDPAYDESKYSRLIAKKFNTRHTAVTLSPDAFLDELPDAISAVDSPTGDGVNTYVVAKATRQAGITVALSGLGGDELFAGYSYFLKWLQTQRGLLPNIPKPLRVTMGHVMSLSARSKHRRAADILGAERLDLRSVYPAFRQVMSRQTAAAYVPSAGGTHTIHQLLDDKRDAIARFPLLSQVTIAELLGYTRDVLLRDTDQFSMASALEVREPFFDYTLIEYVLHIPDAIKFPASPKKLLVEALSPLLPDEIVHRQKQGFVLPWAQWMRHELRDFCRRSLDRLGERGILNPAQLSAHWTAFSQPNSDVPWSELWHLVVLSEWLDANGF
jgi:asparagine synthase (glutamine-hydrolysing)